jgi:hypothetical protein
MSEQETLPVEQDAAAPQMFYSVTTLMDVGLGIGPGIAGWIQRVVAERGYDKHSILKAYVEAGDRDGAVKFLMDARWQHREDALARGTAAHNLLEGYALGTLLTSVQAGEDVPDDVLPYDAQIRRFLADHQPRFLMAEAPVYHPALSYAGTLDAIVEIGGRTYVADMKTTAKLPDARSRPPYPEIGLQLVAYRRAELVGLTPPVRQEISRRRYYAYDPALEHEPMPAVDGALALVVSPVDYRLLPIRTDETVWRAWRHVLQVARFQIHTSKTVVGWEIVPPEASA